MKARRATGHVKLVERKRGDQWCIKYRRPDGRQVERKLGPAWTGPGRPPEGFYTRRTAEEALQAVLTDLRGGIGAEGRSDARFADAAAEYLRYVEHIRQVGKVTVRDYRGVINGYLLPAFGLQPLEVITPDMIDNYKNGLITENRLSNRVIVRHLTVLHGIFQACRTGVGARAQPRISRPRGATQGDLHRGIQGL